jgi:hypothetical protein
LALLESLLKKLLEEFETGQLGLTHQKYVAHFLHPFRHTEDEFQYGEKVTFQLRRNVTLLLCSNTQNQLV